MAFGKTHLCVAQHVFIFHYMIKSFKHKGLQKFFETGSTAGVQSVHKKN